MGDCSRGACYVNFPEILLPLARAEANRYRPDLMTNNDILYRLCAIFNYDDARLTEIMNLENKEITQVQAAAYLKPEKDRFFERCSDSVLADFLNGLITEHRGKKEGEPPRREDQLSNNAVLRKLKIALNLKAEDIQDILAQADFDVSKHEISALFRKYGHKNYRECGDQLLRNFLTGLKKSGLRSAKA